MRVFNVSFSVTFGKEEADEYAQERESDVYSSTERLLEEAERVDDKISLRWGGTQ